MYKLNIRILAQRTPHYIRFIQKNVSDSRLKTNNANEDHYHPYGYYAPLSATRRLPRCNDFHYPSKFEKNSWKYYYKTVGGFSIQSFCIWVVVWATGVGAARYVSWLRAQFIEAVVREYRLGVRLKHRSAGVVCRHERLFKCPVLDCLLLRGC